MSTDITNTYQSKQQASDDDIDLLALFFNILRGWKTILFLALLGLIVGVLYSRYLNPTFRSDALIQIDEKSQGISALGANISELVSSDVSPAQTEAELIKSRMVLQPVVDLLHLRIRLNDETVSAVDRIRRNQTDTQVNTPQNVTLNTEDGKIQISQFNVSKAYLNQNFTISRSGTKDGFILSNGFDEFKGEMNQSHRFNGTDGVIQITVNDLPSANHPISLTKQSLHISMDALNGALSVVERGKQTGIIELSLIGSNQQQISRILEQIVKSYVSQNQSRGSEETTKTIDFMETQIPELKAKLESSEAAFNDFRKKYGTIDVSKEAEILLAENSQIDTQLNELKLKQVDLTTYYTNEHPLVIQINDQLKVLNARKKVIDGTIAGLPEVQREFLTLSEDVGINREIYLTMIKNYQQLKIVKAGQIGYARIIDMPIDTFRAIAPKKLFIISLATILGAMIGTLLVIIKNLLRNVVKDPERLEMKTGVPVIATIPRSPELSKLLKSKKNAKRLLAYADNNSLSYEAIKSLRTHLMFALPSIGKTGQRAKVILISGESPSIGKSFISANLGEVFGQLNKKILIIDADMRLGELHNLFNLSFENGLADYFSKENGGMQENGDISNFIHPTSLDNIDFMPRGQHPHNPTSILASEKFDNLMMNLNGCYDYIIIDSPPVLAASDPIILARHADTVLMVTRYDKSIEGQLVHAINQFNKANIEVDGIVLNDVQQGLTSKYSYHYSYAYGDNK